MIKNEVAIMPIMPSTTAPLSILKIYRKLPANMIPAPSNIVLFEAFLISNTKLRSLKKSVIGNNR